MVTKKPLTNPQDFLYELKQVFDKYDNVKLTSVYEDLYHDKSDLKLLFIISKEEKNRDRMLQ